MSLWALPGSVRIFTYHERGAEVQPALPARGWIVSSVSSLFISSAGDFVLLTFKRQDNKTTLLHNARTFFIIFETV